MVEPRVNIRWRCPGADVLLANRSKYHDWSFPKDPARPGRAREGRGGARGGRGGRSRRPARAALSTQRHRSAATSGGSSGALLGGRRVVGEDDVSPYLVN